ncbi:MAG: bifunctional DNA-formamidopyrimidine glycosylase/DNA-(apurinic or apyrimidinic site) lyase [SAR324 cluster bacterium]|nr:bifunctional DNA-formamidopyrimidine glycosylase/DNA-(apurinic or apyrimidinic site) lyase [SAR324 cluster bacterium]
MPELPEVETVVRGLQKLVVSQKITSVQVFRNNAITPLSPEIFAQRLTGSTIEAVTRRGKFLIFQLNPRLWLLAHLRMTGKFIVTSLLSTPQKHHRAWFQLDHTQLMIFDDMRCFGTLELVESLDDTKKIQQLGIEPLSSQLTWNHLKDCFNQSSTAIKNLLMDQTKIAGIGNIYASEILFEARISPLRTGSQLSIQELKKLKKSIQKILNAAIDKNGTSISDFRKVDEKTGEFQNFLKVYGKNELPCFHCSTPIQRIIQQQRSSFFCSSCQQ